MSTGGCSLNWGGLDRAIEQAARKIAHRKLLMESVGEALVSGAVERFSKEEAPDGTKWEASRRALEESGQTLTDSARLKTSVDYAATDDSVMVGSNLAYARIHQLGGRAGRGRKVKLPARPYLGVSKADMEEVKHLIHDFLAGSFNIRG